MLLKLSRQFWNLRQIGFVGLGIIASSGLGHAYQAASSNPAAAAKNPVAYIDTGFENASPLSYDFDTNGTVQIHLLYDHERSAPNRAAGHFHFRIDADPTAEVTIELNNLENVWNGTRASVAKELQTVVISDDQQRWRPLATEPTQDGRIRFRVAMTGPKMWVARVEPYRISDLDRLLKTIAEMPDVQVSEIGRTVGGRRLEIVRIGNEAATHRVFLRARAHPWEAGGNWVMHGLIERLVQPDAEANRWKQSICFYLMPMANKDGVAMGRTRFTLSGMDLNRNWNAVSDEQLCPENFALEQWLVQMINRGHKPQLAMEIHNDGNGKLHVSRPPIEGLDDHVERMRILESLLRRHTWFSEGSTGANFKNAGTLGEGWLLRYGVDALVHEFNCNWIASLQTQPMGKHWQDYGAQLPRVFTDYFSTVDATRSVPPAQPKN
jgi:hypothetical protein